MHKQFNRRQFLHLSGAAAIGAVLAACGSTPTATPAPTATKPPAPTATKPAAAAPTTAPAAAPTATKPAAAAPTAAPAAVSFKEAPMLADLVKAGKLPTVDKRLPSNPLVVKPTDAIGTYGGRWRAGMLGRSDTAWLGRSFAYEGLMRWSPDLKSVIANVAVSYSVSPNGLEYTFPMRAGMKWSDGEACDANDLVFWYEDVLLNDELTRTKPTWFKSKGKLGKLVKVNDTTFKLVFEDPAGLLTQYLAGTTTAFWGPEHYMKQFHVKYNKDKVDAAVKEQKLQDWVAYYGLKNDAYQNVERPVFFGWQIVTGTGDTSQVLVRRNPYYWKVDPSGNQLPYIDEIVYPIVEKVDALVLKALNGEIDMQFRHIATPDNKAVFTDSKAKGGYDFYQVDVAFENPCVIALNLNHKDPGLKEVFNKKDFRIALSHALNRKEIIDTLYVGDGTPAQAAPYPESPHYHEKLEKQYLEYDPAKANKLLDDLGLKKGADGWRVRLDGKPLFFTMECALAFEPWPQTLEMCVKYWKAVGVNCATKSFERSLFYAHKDAWDHDGGVWTGADGIVAIMDPRWAFPYSSESLFGVAWAAWWNTAGKSGEEPPAAAKEQQKLYESLQAEPDLAKPKTIMKQILDIAADNFWCMAIMHYYKGYGIVKNNFKNVPKKLYDWHLCAAPAQTNPEQYYITK
jgi:peptide/nickel transport system substrate-binding protein